MPGLPGILHERHNRIGSPGVPSLGSWNVARQLSLLNALVTDNFLPLVVIVNEVEVRLILIEPTPGVGAWTAEEHEIVIGLEISQLQAPGSAGPHLRQACPGKPSDVQDDSDIDRGEIRA